MMFIKHLLGAQQLSGAEGNQLAKIDWSCLHGGGSDRHLEGGVQRLGGHAGVEVGTQGLRGVHRE